MASLQGVNVRALAPSVYAGVRTAKNFRLLQGFQRSLERAVGFWRTFSVSSSYERAGSFNVRYETTAIVKTRT
jgi:hypothetical protein